MPDAVLLIGSSDDAATAVAAARELAASGAAVVPWLAPRAGPEEGPLLAAARAAADRVVELAGTVDRARADAADVRVDRQARIVAERMLRLQAGQRVLLEGPDVALPLLLAVERRARAAGALPELRVRPDGLERVLLEDSTLPALAAPDPILLAAVEASDATLRVLGERRPDALAGIPPDREAARTHGGAPARAARLRRSAEGSLRWAVTVAPSDGLAAESGLSPAAFERLVYAAAKVDRDDPLAAWDVQAAVQERLRERLEAAGTLRIVAPETDITLSIAGRHWRSSAAYRNLPDGEVFTGPVEDSAEGFVHFDLPSRRAGQRVAGVRLRFAAGEVVEATADEGQELLEAALALDAGARRLGEVGIGTNYGLDRGTGIVLLDEKIGGTFHLALGAGYPETGSTNRSVEHWDLVGDLRHGGELLLDGRPLVRDGRFLDGLQDGL